MTSPRGEHDLDSGVRGLFARAPGELDDYLMRVDPATGRTTRLELAIDHEREAIRTRRWG